ncbi:MAG: hypothetical protein ABH821_06300 [archaeon]
MNEKSFTGNEKGNLIIIILMGFLAVMLLPPIAMTIFPPAKWLFAIIIVFVIYSMVRTYIGSPFLSIAITGVLVYFLVWKYLMFTSSIFVMQLLLGVGFGSALIWGLAMSPFAKKH